MYINKSATNTETKRKKYRLHDLKFTLYKVTEKVHGYSNDVNDYSDLGIISKQV